MSDPRLARRYALALSELSPEQPAFERIIEQVQALAGHWQQGSELRAVFENPSLHQDQRRAVIDDLTKRMNIEPVLHKTLLLLCDRRRLEVLPSLHGALRDLLSERTGTVTAHVRSADPLPEAYINELRSALEGATGFRIAVDAKTDATMLGGVVAKVGDRVFDGTVRHRLQQIGEQLLDDDLFAKSPTQLT